jgi:peptidoglycan/LPS O-acetylase OafA/YrhL
MKGPYPCDPEPIFELADGSVPPEQELKVRNHLKDCKGCLDLYERELRLNTSLGSLAFEEPRSVCRGVAMALPTRSLRARLLWAVLALALLLTTSVTMILGGINPAALAVETVSVFWGFVAGLADMVRVVFAAVGPALLVALALGAFVDLALVAVYLSVSRRRAREA